MKSSKFNIWKYFLALGILFIGYASIRHAFQLKNPISSDLAFEADIFSVDNLYDEDEGRFSGEIISKSVFQFKTTEETDGKFIVENRFRASKPDGSLIYEVTRKLGSTASGWHVPGLGDRARNGYVFGPPNGDTTSFVYWHVNYDTPATMQFAGTENLFGLRVNRFECHYEADQTSNLAHLPGVPEKRGIALDIFLQLWIEPETQRIIKYEDFTDAWYYNAETKQRTNPWNSFHNEFLNTAVLRQVQDVKNIKLKINLLTYLVPILLLAIAIILIFSTTRFWERKVAGKKALWLAMFILCTGIGICAFSFYRFNEFSELDQVEETELLGKEIVSSLKHEIEVCTEALEFLRYYYLANDSVTESQFSATASRLIKRTNSIRGFSWLPKLNQQNVAAWKSKGYQFKSVQDAKVPSNKVFIWPVQYIEPKGVNRSAIGFDVSSRSATYNLLKKVSSLKSIYASAPVVLVQEKDTTKLSVIIANPVIIGKDSCIGSLNGVIRIPDLVTTATSRFSLPNNYELRIYDVTGNPKQIFSKKRGVLLENEVAFSKSLPLLGRIWHLEIYAPKTVIETPYMFLLLLGVFGTIIAALLVYKILTDNTRNLAITNRKLEIQSEELRNKNAELEQFIYIASHDLREPLNTTMSFVDLIGEENDQKLDEESQTYLTYAKEQLARMGSLIKSLGDYIRIGNSEVKTLENLSELVSRVLTVLSSEIQSRDAKITMDSLPSMPVYKGEMITIWEQLILNALKFHNPNSTCAIHIGAEEKEDHYLFSVSDNGIGISPQYFDKIFEIFKRLHPRDEISGTGIGLSICKKAVDMHRGKIWVKSEMGNGATFYFTIPMG